MMVTLWGFAVGAPAKAGAVNSNSRLARIAFMRARTPNKNNIAAAILFLLGVLARMKAILASLLLLLTAPAFAGAPTAKPQSVTIIDVPRERRDYGTNVGNIKVEFTDGYSEMW